MDTECTQRGEPDDYALAQQPRIGDSQALVEPPQSSALAQGDPHEPVHEQPGQTKQGQQGHTRDGGVNLQEIQEG